MGINFFQIFAKHKHHQVETVMLQRMKEAESGAESEKIKEEFEAKFEQMNIQQV